MIWRWVATLLLALTAYVTASCIWGVPLFLAAHEGIVEGERNQEGARAARVVTAIEDARWALEAGDPIEFDLGEMTPVPENGAEEAPSEIKSAGRLNVPAAHEPISIVSIYLAVIGVWSGLYWLFQRQLRKDQPLRTIARMQIALPILALVAWLPLTFHGVWWNMFAYW